MNLKRAVVPTLFVLAAAIKLPPVLGLFAPGRIPGAYGVRFDDPNLLILLRHRAGLFAIVGVLLLAAAFTPRLRPLATLVGLYSMISFNVVVWLDGPTNELLVRYAGIDLVGIALLIAAYLLDKRGL